MFTTSVWLSVWGWKVVENLRLHPNRDHKVRQTVIRKRESRSKIILLGKPKWGQTYWKKHFAVWEANVVLWHRIKKGHIWKATENNPYCIMFAKNCRDSIEKIHRYGFPQTRRKREGLVQTMLLTRWLTLWKKSGSSDELFYLSGQGWPEETAAEIEDGFCSANQLILEGTNCEGDEALARHLDVRAALQNPS